MPQQGEISLLPEKETGKGRMPRRLEYLRNTHVFAAKEGRQVFASEQGRAIRMGKVEFDWVSF